MCSHGLFARVFGVHAGLLLVLAGCSRPADDSPPRTTLASSEHVGTAVAAVQSNPPPPSLSTFAVYATESVSINASAVVTGGDVGVAYATGPFLSNNVAASLNSGASLDTSHTLYADSVLLNSGATLGAVDTNHLTDHGSTHGTVSTLPAMPSLPTPPTGTAGSTNVTVNSGTRTLAAGSYGAVTINSGTIQLSGGTYVVASLTLNSNATLLVEAASTVIVTGSSVFNSGSFTGPASGTGLTAKSLQLDSLSTSGSAFTLNSNAEVHALVLATKTLVTLNSGDKFYGAIAAAEVNLNSGATVTFQDGFGSTGCATSCDDGNACTSDACVSGACTHTSVANGTSCNDGNACTQTDTCQTGTCTGSNPIACTAADSCHVAGTCNASTGACTTPTAPDGTSCNDGNACTQTDSCQSGTCTGSNPVTCTAADSCHVAGTCNTSTGACTTPAAPNGTSCNDGNACTQTDSCQSGTCTGSNPVTCIAADSCHVAGTCNTSTGACTTPAAPNGTRCNDGNACTQSDSCQSGTCTGSNPVTCTAADSCHVAGTCNASTGACTTPAAPNGTSCNDGNACTQTDSCTSGTCVGSNPITCPASTACQTVGACSTTTGACTTTAAAAGTSCSDGNLCDSPSTCNGSGGCNAGTPINVDDGNACTTDACNPATGVITHTAITTGSCGADTTPPTWSAATLGVTSTSSMSGTLTWSGATDNIAVTGYYVYENGSQVATTGATATSYAASGLSTGQTYAFQVQAFDAAGNVSTGGPTASFQPLPQIAALVAPPLNGTTVTDILDASSFLIGGSDPIQVGVAPGTILRTSAGVLHGIVQSVNGNGFPGATITVLNHPEFGQTYTHADGTYDLLVNAGGWMTVVITAPGALDVQRTVNLPWRTQTQVPTVVLTLLDPAVTALDFSSTGSQLARGSVQTDGDGTRQGTIYFPAGTGATATLPDGTSLPLTTAHLRITEFTVGPTGLAAMPASLPPTSAYTYAFAVDIDEATALGAKHIALTTPAVYYVDNFLHFPVGLGVPLGYLDPDTAMWVPEPSGVVVGVVSVSGGVAALDLNGDGAADPQSALDSLGITADELLQIATLYSEGDTFWRSQLPHLSHWDSNVGAVPPADAKDANASSGADGNAACIRKKKGSIIECENQFVGESVPVVGTPFSLNYWSDRTSGYVAGRTAVVDLPAGDEPSSVKRVDIEWRVAGRVFHTSYPPFLTGAQSLSLVWDGKDWLGRTLQGKQPLVAHIGYVYPAVYGAVSAFGYEASPPDIITTVRDGEAFSTFPSILGSEPINGPAPQYPDEITFWTDLDVDVGTVDSQQLGLGGWTLSANDLYDLTTHTLYRGDGSRVEGDVVHGLATQTITGSVAGVTNGLLVGADGSIYYGDARRGDFGGGLIRMTPDGVNHQFAPNLQPQAMAMGPNGELYVSIAADGNSSNDILYDVVRVAPDGTQTVFAGNGSGYYDTDGGLPATSVSLGYVVGIAADPGGNVYLANDAFIRRVDPSGIVSNYVNGEPGNINGGEHYPYGPTSIALDRHGNLWVLATGADAFLEEIDPIGNVVLTSALVFNNNYIGGGVNTGDDGPLSNAQVIGTCITVGPDDTVYIGTHNGIRALSPDGNIRLVAGAGGPVSYGYNASAYYSAMSVRSIAMAPDGSVVYIDDDSGQIRRMTSSLPGITTGNLVIADSSSTLAVFDAYGRHLETVDRTTGNVLLSLGYDASGRLSSATDVDGNVTQVLRDAAGLATSIVAPYGPTTQLGLDTSGRITTITNPNAESVNVAFGVTNLISTFTDARGGVHTLAYSPDGRLTSDSDPAGGGTSLQRTEGADGWSVEESDALARTTLLAVQHPAAGGELHTTITPDGLTSTTTLNAGGGTSSTAADGTTSTFTPIADPRFGTDTSLGAMTMTTPLGVSMTVSTSESVNLSDPNDPLSVVSLVSTTTINGGSGNPNGSTFASVYNASTLTWTSYSAATPARIATATTDTHGNVVSSQVGGLTPVTYGYDAAGRLTNVTQGARTSSIAYGADGVPASSTDALSRTTSVARDAAGRPLAWTLPDGRIVQMTYDANGNVTSVTPPGRPAHDMAYTPVDLLASYLPPDAPSAVHAETQYSYNLAKQLTSAALPDGETIQYAYDAAGRLSTMAYPADEVSLSYDATHGHLAAVSSSAESTALSYDGPVLTGLTWSGEVAGAMAYAYDSQMRLASESLNGESPIARSYDADALLTQVGALAVGRDATSGLVTGTAIGSVSDSIGYNSFGEPTTYAATAGSTSIYGVSYVRDALGRITQKTETNGGTTSAWGYAYDATGRLTDVTLGGAAYAHYDFDANGNRLDRVAPDGTETATYDAQDRVETYDGKTYTFTANGALATVTNETGTTTFTYDAMGNLRHVALPDGRSIDYVIDGANRRIGKKINGALVQAFLYGGGLGPVAELDGSGNLVSRFVYAGGGNVPEYMVKGGNTYRFVKDQLGSPRALVDVATGVVLEQMDFDEYGRVLGDTAPGVQPFGFAGGIWDQDVGLVRFGARDYDAVSGRWTGKDPLGFGGGLANLYDYVGGDPVNRKDPRGRWGLFVQGEGSGSFGPGVSQQVGGFLGFGGSESGAYLDSDVIGSALPQLGVGASVGFYTGDANGMLNSNGFTLDFGVASVAVLNGPDGWGLSAGLGLNLNPLPNFVVNLDQGDALEKDLPQAFANSLELEHAIDALRAMFGSQSCPVDLH